MAENIPQITFDQLHAAVAELHRKMDAIMAAIGSPLPERDLDRLLTMEQLIDYLPDHPARATVFGWTCARTIPFQKHGRRLYFRVGDIDEWLNHGVFLLVLF